MSVAKKQIRTIKPDGHPYHPAFVHFPIAFIVSAQTLDIAYGLTAHPSTANYVSGIYDLKPYLGDIARLGFLSTVLAIITGVPAIATGAAQLLKLLDRQAYADKVSRANASGSKVVELAQQTHPKVQMAFIHAATMWLSMAAMMINWFTRKGAPMSAPGFDNVIISAVSLPILLGSSYLGAQLVYRYGVGVEPQAVWSKKTQ